MNILKYFKRKNLQQEVELVLGENRRVIVDEVAAMLDVSHGSAHHIIHDVL
jgi:hypothetical protein